MTRNQQYTVFQNLTAEFEFKEDVIKRNKDGFVF
jgi:hypothetical protein